MSITCQYDQLKYPFFVGDIPRLVTVDAKLRLPESLPKIRTIIGGDFETGPLTCAVKEGLIVVSGKVYPQVLFMAELPQDRKRLDRNYDDHDENNYDEEVEEVSLPQEYGVNWRGEDGINFEERIEIPDLHPEALVQAETVSLRGVYEKEAPDLIAFRGSLELIISATHHQTAEIVGDISIQATEKINLMKELVTVEELLDIKKVTMPIQANLILPSLKPGVARVLKVLVRPAGVNQEVARGRLFLRGGLEVSAVYVGSDDEGNPTEIFANDWGHETGSAIPFETHLDLEASEGEVLALPKIAVRDILVEPRSSHELHCLMNLDFEVAISRLYQKEMVVEASSDGDELIDTQRYLINIEEHSGEASGEVVLEQEIELPNNCANMELVLTSYGRLRNITVEASEDRALIEGGLNLGLIYLSEEAEKGRLQIAVWDETVDHRLPLAGIVEFPGLQPGTLLRAQLAIESLKAEMIDDRKLKLFGVVKARVLARNPRALFVLKDCALVVPVDPDTRPSMLFYLVQQDDSLWKIARRYQTTVAALMKVNQIDNQEDIAAGQKLLIPKKVIDI